jgi:BMFP domain-containing protein YqiC
MPATANWMPAMNAPNRLLDEVARLVTDAAGAAQGVRREVETVVKTQVQRLLADMDVVTREEFEAVREMAIMAREENDKLGARLAALEGVGETKAKPKKG